MHFVYVARGSERENKECPDILSVDKIIVILESTLIISI